MNTYLITGNPNKLRELQDILPESLGLEARQVELDEIQSLDLREIVEHKLRQAYAAVQSPVVVEDVSAELEKLNGLPGPFIKFFNQRLGNDALYQLGGEGARAKITCSMGYFDGVGSVIVDGVVEGSITKPRVSNGFGFDSVFVPDGYSQTYAELGSEVKNEISHRAIAAKSLAKRLTQGKDWA